ncbi:MAG: hypothetical protein KJZ78_24185, partial [Bryobacteraceae bacterium]|nr:hypothetical protein [Bryobacteraceae bacterium]
AEDLGTLDSRAFTAQRYAPGMSWYRLQASRSAILTAEALYDPQQGELQLVLLDVALNPVPRLSPLSSSPRVDTMAIGGATYYLGIIARPKLPGRLISADLRIVNLVSREGTRVAVAGSSGSDTFRLTQQGQYVVIANGVRYQFSSREVSAIEISGGAGEDTAWITGHAVRETLVASPGSAQLRRKGLTVQTTGVEQLTVHGGPGDTAVLYGSFEPDHFVGDYRSARLSGPGFSSRARGFAKVTALARPGGHDVAEVGGSPGNDTFRGLAGLATMYGKKYRLTVRAFDEVLADAGLGFDKARLLDTTGNDHLVLGPEESRMTGPNLDISIRGFEQAQALSHNGGFDTAEIEGSAGDDILEATADWVRVSRFEGDFRLLYEAIAFEHVRTRRSAGQIRDETSLSALFLEVNGLYDESI